MYYHGFVSAIAAFFIKEIRAHAFSYIYTSPIMVLSSAMQIFPFLSFQEEINELLGSLSSFFSSYYIIKDGGCEMNYELMDSGLVFIYSLSVLYF